MPASSCSSWQWRRLGEFASEVRVPFEPAENEGRPYVGLEHIEQDTLVLRGHGDSAGVKSTKREFQRGDVLFGSLRPYFRKVVRPRFAGVCSTDITVIRHVDGASDPAFLRYFLANRDFISHASNVASGTRMPRANWRTLSRSSWRVPPLPTQRKIAAILSAYDDLIENSFRRLKVLEEMARNLYREWFVEFRFPGHEHARFVDSAVGRIPKGWGVVGLLDVADVAYGFPFRSKNFTQDRVGLPVVRIRNVLAGESSTFSEEVPSNPDRYRVLTGDILVGMDGAFHIGFWIGGEAWLVQRVARFRPTQEGMSHLHLFLAIQEPIRRLNAAITGTTVAHLGHRHIKAIKLALPPKPLLLRTAEMLNPIRSECFLLRSRNKILRQARDLLLPRLISGDIDLSALPVRTAPLAGDGAAEGDDITHYDFFRAITDLAFVDKIVRFGSRARGVHEDRSDIDLAVFCDGASDEEWRQVLACLREDRIDTLRNATCVRFDECDAVLRQNVLSEGVVLYEKGDGG